MRGESIFLSVRRARSEIFKPLIVFLADNQKALLEFYALIWTKLI